DELSEDDKLTVARARKIQRFLSQPFHVAEVFTGTPGVLVSLEDTIKGFKGIVAGAYDDLPESAFYMVGTIDEVVAKARKMAAELDRSGAERAIAEAREDLAEAKTDVARAAAENEIAVGEAAIAALESNVY